jgi:hypothetical protein
MKRFRFTKSRGDTGETFILWVHPFIVSVEWSLVIIYFPLLLIQIADASHLLPFLHKIVPAPILEYRWRYDISFACTLFIILNIWFIFYIDISFRSIGILFLCLLCLLYQVKYWILLHSTLTSILLLILLSF